jgi:transcription elongation factor GreA
VTITTASKKSVYLLVKSEEIDLSAHKISINSPLGKALLNRCVKDKIHVDTPSGKIEYEILSID